MGEAAARDLARHGAKLVLGVRRLDRLQALAKELSLGNDAAVRTDVTPVRTGQTSRGSCGEVPWAPSAFNLDAYVAAARSPLRSKHADAIITGDER